MKNIAFIVVLLFAISAVFYYIAISSENNLELENKYVLQNVSVRIVPQTSPAECVEGARKICATEDGCDGETLCFGGRWSGCSIKRVCRPGRVAPCPIDSCNFGLRTCDECGDKWSECIYHGE